ncbi:hypothetical protein ACH5AO_18200 [Streptomyces sp. NPDC018964]
MEARLGLFAGRINGCGSRTDVHTEEAAAAVGDHRTGRSGRSG